MNSNSENNKKTDSEKYVTHDDVAAMVSFGSTYLKFAISTFVVVVGFFALLKHYPVATLIGTAAIILAMYISMKLLMKWADKVEVPKVSEEDAQKILHSMALAYLVSKDKLIKDKSQASE